MWTQHHYAKSPLVESVRCVGATTRFLIHPGDVNLALEGSRFPAGFPVYPFQEMRLPLPILVWAVGVWEPHHAVPQHGEYRGNTAIPPAEEKWQLRRSGCPGASVY